jgi:leucyl aminopeptidase
MKINAVKKSDAKVNISFEFGKKAGKIKDDGKVVHVDLGEEKDFDNHVLRECVSSAARYAKDKEEKKISISVGELDLYKIAETALLALHNPQPLKTKKETPVLKEIDLIVKDTKSAVTLIKKSNVVAGSVNWVKDLVNLPANIATPKYIVSEAKKGIKNAKFTVFDKKRIIKEGLNLMEAVTRTSMYEPQFLITEYKPKNAKNKKPYVLVGKGITFDTGGVSLKPSSFPYNAMRGMKCDMAGAASVLGAVKAVSELGLPYHVIAITPLCENAIGGKAYRVDDVIKSHSGVTVEITNTDAEGRLVLADALSYSKRYKPEFVVDIATLTGAALLALGDKAACYMSNSDELAGNMEIASLHTDEKIWRFPLWKEYDKELESNVADTLNNPDKKGPGTITAAKFLQKFVDEKQKWGHIDIGVSGFVTEDRALSYNGATGLGVRLLIDLVESYE